MCGEARFSLVRWRWLLPVAFFSHLAAAEPGISPAARPELKAMSMAVSNAAKPVPTVTGAQNVAANQVPAFVDFGITSGLAWRRYQNEFVSANGRVMDRGQGNISHSEGQGYGLLMALMLDDRARFASLWRWTSTHLAVRSDGLIAWRWGRANTDIAAVTDINNATDGDVLIAWALLQASARWQLPRYQTAALRLLAAIRGELLVPRPGRKYLLPGKDGFALTDGVWLNPSYCLLPAFTAFASAQPEQAEFWQQLRSDCLYLSAKATEFNGGVVPDWVKLDASGRVVGVRASASNGADAIRLPLYFAWDNEVAPGLNGLLSALTPAQPLSADTALTTAAAVQVTPAAKSNALNYMNAGYYALLARAAGMGAQARTLARQADIAWTTEPAQYYGDSLYLLARYRPFPVRAAGLTTPATAAVEASALPVAAVSKGARP